MALDAARWLEELVARVQLARGVPTLLSVSVRASSDVDDARRTLVRLLGASDVSARDLGATGANVGPVAWAEASRDEAGDVFVVSIFANTPLSRRALADLVNAQRQSLRELAGPLVLVTTDAVDAALRQHAPDFVTWVAQSYELPSDEDLRRLLAAAGGAPPAPVVDATPPVRFLHLSDLHLRPAAVKRHDQDRVLNGLLALLERERAAAPFDLVFVTGDLANAGVAEEYAVVVAFLKRVMEAAAVPRERVFVVPGNHDVDRGVARWLLRTLASDAESTEFFVNDRSRRWHAEKFAAYRAAMDEALGSRAHGLRVGEGAVELVEVRGARIAVASFNSAWFAQADDDMEKLWIGEANVSRAAAAVADADVAVALMHHPTAHLAPDDQAAVEPLLERGFDLVLRGHLHRERARVSHGARGTVVEVAAPASYQGSQWPNGCFVGELRVAERSLRLKPFMFGSGADPWVLDPKVFPDDAADGYCHTFKLGQRRRVRGVAEGGAASPARAFWALDRSDRLALARRLGVTGASDDEVERRAAAQVGRSGEGADVWRELASRAGASGRTEALDGVVAESALEAHVQRVDRSDPNYFAAALQAIAALWPHLPPTLAGEEPAVLEALVFALLRLTLGVSVSRDLRDTGVDFVVQGLDGDLRGGAAINVKRRSAPTRHMQEDMERIVSFAARRGLRHAALFVIAPPSATAEAPIDRVVHASGVEAFTLRLPLPQSHATKSSG